MWIPSYILHHRWNHHRVDDMPVHLPCIVKLFVIPTLYSGWYAFHIMHVLQLVLNHQSTAVTFVQYLHLHHKSLTSLLRYQQHLQPRLVCVLNLQHLCLLVCVSFLPFSCIPPSYPNHHGEYDSLQTLLYVVPDTLVYRILTY